MKYFIIMVLAFAAAQVQASSVAPESSRSNWLLAESGKHASLSLNDATELVQKRTPTRVIRRGTGDQLYFAGRFSAADFVFRFCLARAWRNTSIDERRHCALGLRHPAASRHQRQSAQSIHSACDWRTVSAVPQSDLPGNDGTLSWHRIDRQCLVAHAVARPPTPRDAFRRSAAGGASSGKTIRRKLLSVQSEFSALALTTPAAPSADPTKIYLT